MGLTIQADKNGALVVPAELVGRVEPGATYSVEPHGDVVILHRQPAENAPAELEQAAAEKIARLREWIASLPPSPPIPLDALRRDSMYD